MTSTDAPCPECRPIPLRDRNPGGTARIPRCPVPCVPTRLRKAADRPANPFRCRPLPQGRAHARTDSAVVGTVTALTSAAFDAQHFERYGHHAKPGPHFHTLRRFAIRLPREAKFRIGPASSAVRNALEGDRSVNWANVPVRRPPGMGGTLARTRRPDHADAKRGHDSRMA